MKALVLVLIILAGLPLRAGTIVAEPFPPAQLKSLYIEKDDKGKSTTLQVAGDAVIFKITMAGQVLDSATVHPSDEDWFKFIQGLNAAKVYKWSSDYSYPGQGVTWVVDLGFEDRKLTSGGTNDYPKEGAEDQPQADPKAGPSVPFQIFWQSALALVGKTPPPKVEK